MVAWPCRVVFKACDTIG